MDEKHPRRLTLVEIEALRKDMKESSEWARAELKRRQEQREKQASTSENNALTK